METVQQTTKRGDEITLTNSNNSLKYYKNDLGTKVQIYYARRDYVEVDLISVTDSEIKLRLPANYPGAIIRSISLALGGSPVSVTLLSGTISVTD
jgi:hypothetical protein